MLRRISLCLAVLLLCVSALPATSGDEAMLDKYFGRSTLEIATPDARVHRFNIWIADRAQLQERGLMYIKTLAPDAGMLFIYPAPRPMSMWMKNTYVPLDMLFVRADGRVDSVVRDTKPLTLTTIESKNPVLAVIELNAGTAARLNIVPGAQIIHPAFDSH